MSDNRERFSSRLGFILAAAGSAVGIGNLVGFPVSATKNGGGAFLLIYALFVVFICLPVMMAEMAMGRNAQKDPLGSYKLLANNDKKWKFAGFLAVLTPFMIAVFYMVITVWIFGYLIQAGMGNLDALADPAHFGTFINSYTVFAYMAVVVVIVNLILLGGVKQGIEKAAKVLMPALLVMLLALVAYVLTLDNALAGVEYYVIPDFSKMSASVLNGALSQAFFSLSLGMGILMTYASYISKKDDIVSSAKMVAITDSLVAFVAGLMVLPAIFSFDPNTNPESLSDSSVSMIFVYLPKILLALQNDIGYVGASVVAFSFFLLVFFAAITSLVSIVEVPTATLSDRKGISRKKALGILTLSTGVLTIICTMSFGMVDSLTSFTSYGGASKSFFDIVVDVFYDTILPLNGLMVCLFVMYRWKKARLTQELSQGSPSYEGSMMEKYVNFSLSTFIPFILAVIFINTVATKFFGLKLFGF
ncbi:sodium-dependent transporter [Pseudoalteromonas sp. 13-15]|jgi:NSS family neurotransmitter:Na+ symporter|uniref:Sodium-dependent transporter n=1 Tax=Pseudoalteromonas marina TaxID=267375 RepID=A0ABT9FBE2_9GAMM|nr:MULTISPECIES: sodium-dependent transporter [Pseudoalteromonas]MBL1385631.1 sodium-dependent transporter [Colwellia sp.]AUL72974.1 sodium-dependent transporter [Pseudoalteromonas sp. 13-15]MDP2485387.1 sodium-dependent transporter [Pseudoalteromonas marina]MDP2564109.1 sodium-dependent transporter [Pseudoalteromonas marina]WFO20466.1 sodium-dependent transporter [Pseudoalteromonas sp. H100]|tara:strand:+ start:1649 stop:3073 length:1425 start_codon:yes stop_codon:yes gene_type:complete